MSSDFDAHLRVLCNSQPSAGTEEAHQLRGRIQDLEEKLAVVEQDRDRWQRRVLHLEERLANVRRAFNAV